MITKQLLDQQLQQFKLVNGIEFNFIILSKNLYNSLDLETKTYIDSKFKIEIINI